MEPKYKLVKRTKRLWHTAWENTNRKVFYRLLALRDIPEHGVKKGDLGGWVSSKHILSHEGSCWIGGDASAYNHVRIVEDAYIGDNVCILNDFKNCLVTISGNSKMLDNAQLIIMRRDGVEPSTSTNITDNATVSGSAHLINTLEVSGNAIVKGNAKVYNGAVITDHSVVTGKANVSQNAKIRGHSKVCDDAIIHKNAILHNTMVSGKAQIGEGQVFKDKSFDKMGIFIDSEQILKTIPVAKNDSGSIINKEDAVVTLDTYKTNGDSGNNVVTDDSMDVARAYLQEVKKRISDYETDIVKIIKYPLMTDKTNDYTRAMTMALNKAERLSHSDRVEAFEEAIEALEEKFLAAESNAIKALSIGLNEDELKKTETAKNLLSIAGNEASSEHERKIAFIQGFKQLEGIITVPEVAVDTFRIKIGLKELEA